MDEAEAHKRRAVALAIEMLVLLPHENDHVSVATLPPEVKHKFADLVAEIKKIAEVIHDDDDLKIMVEDGEKFLADMNAN